MDIREIARRAKVSTATVSRAINRVPSVDPQLAKRVCKVMEEVGYYPNTQARALDFRAQPHFWADRVGDHQSLLL
jgi:LacI family transcriptional regulator